MCVGSGVQKDATTRKKSLTRKSAFEVSSNKMRPYFGGKSLLFRKTEIIMTDSRNYSTLKPVTSNIINIITVIINCAQIRENMVYKNQ